jgi:hypothetical protein
VKENLRRSTADPEFELLDSGVFDGNRYFDIEVVLYKKAAPDILMEVVFTNRAGLINPRVKTGSK